jgi:hypothetical protein
VKRQTNEFEFEIKQTKIMHHHECTNINPFVLFRKTNNGFYTTFPVKKTNVGRILKLRKKNVV